MADENGNPENPETNGVSGDANGADIGPQLGLISQYIKDMSVENPNSPQVYQWNEQPQIDVQFNIAATPAGDNTHEVELKLTVTAKAEAGTAFLVDLSYAALVGMRNIPDDQAHQVLYAEVPRLTFPFARRVLADAVRDAGFPPLMLEPMDFNALYQQQIAQMAAQGEQPPVGNA